MPRWRALPDELDPQVREFADRLRRLVDRSGLSVAAVADRTGYSSSAWQTYLDARVLPPRGAVTALADVTGTSQVHLLTLWELAERAWDRAGMQRDRTLDALRIAQARAALGDFPRTGHGSQDGPDSPAASGEWPGAPAAPAGEPGARTPYGGRPRQPQRGLPGAPRVGVPAPRQLRTPARPPAPPRRVQPPTAAHRSPRSARPPPRRASPAPGGGGRVLAMFVAGAVGALLVVAAAVLLADLGGDRKGAAGAAADRSAAASAPPARSAASTRPVPDAPPAGTAAPTAAAGPRPASGAGCFGDRCAGRDPESMRCGRPYATTVAYRTVGTTRVEVRHSPVCGAAWARVSGAAPGDVVEVSAAGATHERAVRPGDDDAYTLMVAVSDASEARACATLASGARGCTDPD
ncbi:XRE family transcriptional regulator [Streptomyces sp. CC228A]|uniref:helix-turn-helix domain-containing protein n=1 Tax=Streptomyces sp. CC228A TaxID=2898186 RepID=UPI001F30E7D5|nr:XRE family transcriptional regulator [Streptomyces sp. CC228A]